MITKTALGFAALLFPGVAAIPCAARADETHTISACPTDVNAPGTWTLTGNLTAALNVTCITVTQNGVAIDLHANSITGPGAAAGVGILSNCGNDCYIIVYDGTIKGFQIGIGVSSATIANVNLIQNLYYGLSIGDHAMVSGGQMSNNGTGITISGSNNSINGVHANNNNYCGISISGSNNAINYSQANNNADVGICSYFEGNGNIVSNTQANNNASGGIFLAFGGDIIYVSEAIGNGNTGIAIGGGGNILSFNVITGNGSEGVNIQCPSDLLSNTMLGNPGGDIVVASGSGCARFGNIPVP